MPLFIASLPKNDQNVFTKVLEAAWYWAKGHTISKIKAYANAWFKTPSGSEYRKDYIKSVYISISALFTRSLHAKFYQLVHSKACRPRKYSRPYKLSSQEKMIEFEGRKGLTWRKANLIDFWMVGGPEVETEPTSNGQVGWIKSNEDGSWEKALNSAALLLIRMYCTVLQFSYINPR